MKGLSSSSMWQLVSYLRTEILSQYEHLPEQLTASWLTLRRNGILDLPGEPR